MRSVQPLQPTRVAPLLLAQTRLHLVLTASSSAYAARTRGSWNTLVKSRDGTSPRFFTNQSRSLKLLNHVIRPLFSFFFFFSLEKKYLLSDINFETLLPSIISPTIYRLCRFLSQLRGQTSLSLSLSSFPGIISWPKFQSVSRAKSFHLE